MKTRGRQRGWDAGGSGIRVGSRMSSASGRTVGGEPLGTPRNWNKNWNALEARTIRPLSLFKPGHPGARGRPRAPENCGAPSACLSLHDSGVISGMSPSVSLSVKLDKKLDMPPWKPGQSGSATQFQPGNFFRRRLHEHGFLTGRHQFPSEIWSLHSAVIPVLIGGHWDIFILAIYPSAGSF
jgi:hypothetical protein